MAVVAVTGVATEHSVSPTTQCYCVIRQLSFYPMEESYQKGNFPFHQ